MENAAAQRKRRIMSFAALGTVILLSGFAIALFFLYRPMETLDLAPYVSVEWDALGSPAAHIDTDAILSDLHLPAPNADLRAAQRYPDVAALLAMEPILSETDDPERVSVAIRVDTDTLEQYGIRIASLQWEQPVKGYIVSEASATAPPTLLGSEVTPTPDAHEPGYLTALVDADGNGYNLRAVCERVQKERDDFCKEEFGAENYKVEKIQVSFSVGNTPDAYQNVYTASYRATVESTAAGEDEVALYFRVRLVNLRLNADGTVGFDRHVFTVVCKSEADCKSAPIPVSDYTTAVLSGGGVRVRGKAAFDQNGFVRFPDSPTSYRMANGLYWSPTYDALSEDLIWKLTAVDGHSLANLLRYARKEIFARYYASFDPRSEREFYEHYHTYGWYRELVPDRTVDMTETERANIRLLREIQSLVEK